jgi:hypothetical protein
MAHQIHHKSQTLSLLLPHQRTHAVWRELNGGRNVLLFMESDGRTVHQKRMYVLYVLTVHSHSFIISLCMFYKIDSQSSYRTPNKYSVVLRILI